LDPAEQASSVMARFTDRYTKGDMSLTLIDRTHGYPSFAAAESHAATVRARRSI
jgi:hypothetical protein